MNSHRARGMALAAALAATSIAATSSATAANFDGYWSLVAQTSDGHCGVTRWDVAISDGRLYYPGGSYQGHRVGLGGVVSPSGRLQVNVIAGPRVGNGAGRLGRNRGSGTWAGQGPSGICAGIWTATRVQPGTASAPPWNADSSSFGAGSFRQVPPAFGMAPSQFGMAPRYRGPDRPN
jgi:hypothetical protein